MGDEAVRKAAKEQPNARSKLVAIAGDVEQLGLGISAADLERLKNVNIVYHSAASVRYVKSKYYLYLINKNLSF